MKRLILLVLVLLLCGCSVSTSNVTYELDKLCAETMNSVYYYSNNYTDIMEYYIPSDLQEMDANDYSVQFAYEDSKVVMNVNIAGVIANRYYEYSNDRESLFDPGKLFYSNEGTYTDSDQKAFSYKLNVYTYGDNYLIEFSSKNLKIYGYTNLSDLVPLCSRIFVLAKGAYVREDVIIANYSSKEVIDYHKKQVDLFESILPVNGRIDELLVKEEVQPEETENGVE